MTNVKELVRTIDALYAKATQGEWKHYSAPLRPEFPTRIHEIQVGDKEVVKWGGFDGLLLPKKQISANAQIIAALHNAWPQIRDAIEALSADAWIPVSERLPDDGAQVWACDANPEGSYRTDAMFIDGMFLLFDNTTDAYSFQAHSITHWMPMKPLPEPPAIDEAKK